MGPNHRFRREMVEKKSPIFKVTYFQHEIFEKSEYMLWYTIYKVSAVFASAQTNNSPANFPYWEHVLGRVEMILDG